MDTCQVLIVALFVMLATLPLAIVMALVELLARKRVQRRSNARMARPFNTYALSAL